MVSFEEYSTILKKAFCDQTGTKSLRGDEPLDKKTEWHEEYCKWMNDAIVGAHMKRKSMLENLDDLYKPQIEDLKKEAQRLQANLKKSNSDLKSMTNERNRLLKYPPNAVVEINRLKKSILNENDRYIELENRCENLIKSKLRLESELRSLKENPKYVALVEANSILSRSASSVMNFEKRDSLHVLEKERNDEYNQSAFILKDIRDFEEKCLEKEEYHG